jgi:translocator protein
MPPTSPSTLRSSKLMFLPFMLVLVLTGGFAASFKPGIWYKGLVKPWFTPPDWLFGPVWSVLYVLIAIAGYLVWLRAGWGAALVFWAANIALNGLWSVLMFGQHQITWALIDIVGMWLTIVAFMVAAYPVDRRATWAFAPYLAWVSLATALNFAIWRFN